MPEHKEANEAIVVLHKLGYGYGWIAKALGKKKPNVIKVWHRDKDKYNIPAYDTQKNRLKTQRSLPSQ